MEIKEVSKNFIKHDVKTGDVVFDVSEQEYYLVCAEYDELDDMCLVSLSTGLIYGKYNVQSSVNSGGLIVVNSVLQVERF